MIQYGHMTELAPSSHLEQQVTIPIPDSDLHMTSVLRGSWEQPVVVMLHGLSGSNTSALQYVGSQYLAEHGYATLRVALYDHSPGTRDLRDCTVATHAADFDTAVAFVRQQKAPAVLGVGHSYGGLSILQSRAELDGAALWDPSHFACSYASTAASKPGTYTDLPEQGVRVYFDGRGRIDPLAMIAERSAHKDDGYDAAKKPYPVLFVAAGDGVLAPYVTAYAEAAHPSADLHVVKDATHNFLDSDAVLDDLVTVTKDWFDQCVNL
jgi:dienelactone hydrolase